MPRKTFLFYIVTLLFIPFAVVAQEELPPGVYIINGVKTYDLPGRLKDLYGYLKKVPEKKPNTEALSQIPFKESTEFNKELFYQYEYLVKQNRVYVWEMLDRKDRLAHYCQDECQCIADSIGKDIKQKNLNHRFVRVKMASPGWIGIYTGKDRHLITYTYHVSTLVQIDENSWGAFDPIMFLDSNLHSLREWLERLDKNEEIYTTVSDYQKIIPEPPKPSMWDRLFN